MKIYGTDLCPDCLAAKKILDEKNIPYDYVDVTKNIADLKAFLQLRDTSPAFDEVKKAGNIGVPAFISEDGGISFEVEAYE
ncbi:glutaredoxin [Peptoniphilus sp. EMRHCC_23]|uniref:glutaredoxin domain-containing protein n=1 Tax=Peptoniphilus rachelemmaiella TaxID=2811779 RepID=UPI001C0045CA|nr:glutaredoxin domain-containing protein [Peptoniphilus rachelemmaiella]